MKKFEEICAMTQSELKKYLEKYLLSKGRTVVSQDGFLYSPPSSRTEPVPVLLTAHLDTVHKETVKDIEKLEVRIGTSPTSPIKTKVSSPQGIGGDDRCGVYIIMNVIKRKNVPVLFCEDEESGGIGSKKFTKTDFATDLAASIKYMIELDRKGSNDAVFYSCDNKEFTKWIEENSGYKNSFGTFSDISTLMPEMGIAGVNFSCGYYNAHTLSEYVYIEEMEDTQKMVIELLGKEIPKTFEYVKKTYPSYNYGGYNYNRGCYNYDDYGQYSMYDGYNTYGSYDDYYWDKYSKKTPATTNVSKTNTRSKGAKKNIKLNRDTMVTLYVVPTEGYYDGIDIIPVTGATKPECWMNLFMEYSDFCFDFVDDYWYE